MRTWKIRGEAPEESNQSERSHLGSEELARLDQPHEHADDQAADQVAASVPYGKVESGT